MKFKNSRREEVAHLLEEILPRDPAKRKRVKRARFRAETRGAGTEALKKDIIPELRRRISTLTTSVAYYKKSREAMKKDRNRIKYLYNRSKVLRKKTRAKKKDTQVKVIHTDAVLAKKKFQLSEKVMFLMCHTPAFDQSKSEKERYKMFFMVEMFEGATIDQLKILGFAKKQVYQWADQEFLELFGDIYKLAPKGRRQLDERKALFAREIDKIEKWKNISTTHPTLQKASSVWTKRQLGADPNKTGL